jgi:hypothetical protein
VKTVNARHEKQIRYGISVMILIMIVPSSYLAYNLYYEKKYTLDVEQFITNEFSTMGYTVIYKEITFNAKPKKIELGFLTKKFNDDEIAELNNKLHEYGILNTELIIKQDAIDIKREILKEIGKQNKNLSEKDLMINKLNQELAEYKFDNLNIINEIQILFPDMKEVSIGKHMKNQDNDSLIAQTILVYKSNKKTARADELKLKLWLQEKLGNKSVEIIRYN